MGLGAFSAMHGTYEANLAMHGCDVMVCIGARFDDRVTGRLDSFAPNACKIHIDIGPARSARSCPSRSRLRAIVATCCLDYFHGADVIQPQHAVRRLFELSRAHDPIVATKVGQHQMWAAQQFDFERPMRWLTSGGLGAIEQTSAERTRITGSAGICDRLWRATALGDWSLCIVKAIATVHDRRSMDRSCLPSI